MPRSGDAAADADSSNQQLRRQLDLLVKQVAQLDKDARQAKERIARLEKERSDEQGLRKKGQREAADKTDAAVRRIEVLDAVLASALSARPLTFDHLKEDQDRPAPELALPRDPRLLRVIPGVAGWHERKQQEAQDNHSRAHADHVREMQEAVRRNARIEERRRLFAVGDRPAVEWFIGEVLRDSDYPKSFPRHHVVSYRPERAAIAIDLQLPPPEAVPRVGGYQYDPQLGETRPILRADGEIRQQYKRLIACIALRTIHEIFTATEPHREVVAEVALTGWSTGREEAVGETRAAPILSVSAGRDAFTGLQLTDVQPAECLTGALDGHISPYPFGLVPLEHALPFPRE